MKNSVPLITTSLLGAGLLAAVVSLCFEEKAQAAPPRVDPAHAAHVAAGTAAPPAAAAPVPAAPAPVAPPTPVAPVPADPAHAAHVAASAPATPTPDATKADPVLSHQLSQLQAKVTQLEAALANGAPPKPAAPAGAAMPGMPAAAPTPAPAMGKGMGKMKPAATMPGMSAGAAPAPAMAGMSGSAAPAGGGMGMGMMMPMMDKMMGMMDKMMAMGGAAMPAAAPMAGMPAGGMGMPMPMMEKMMGMMDKMMSMGGGGMGMMDMDMMKMGGMGGGGAMPAAPAAPMSGGGMGMMSMDKMEMAGMMGMGAMSGPATGAMPQSALPGFPGASHLYHIGATGFFFDHPQHIALTTEQQGALNSAKQQALLAKSTADRAIQQAEQELWTLTAADQPDAAVIATKLTEIGKLRADERLSFIHAVGAASKLLTDEQRKILTGFAPPAPVAAPMAAGMKGM